MDTLWEGALIMICAMFTGFMWVALVIMVEVRKDHK